MKPIHTIISALMLTLPSITYAQGYVTYNHDDSKMGQIEVMEMGTGSFTPEIYYSVVHSDYNNNAKNPTSVKNTLRLATGVASFPQVAYSDTIEASMKSRAKIEAMNVADRQIDAAWIAEGSKIENKLLTFRTNISFLNGRAGAAEIASWNELVGLYEFAIKVTKNAYMPNSEREKQYLSIYDEIVASNENLLIRARYLVTKSRAERLVAAINGFTHRVGENATAGYVRWRDAARQTGSDNIIQNKEE